MRKQRHEPFERVQRMFNLHGVVGTQSGLDRGNFLAQAVLKSSNQLAQLDIVSGKFFGTAQVKPR